MTYPVFTTIEVETNNVGASFEQLAHLVGLLSCLTNSTDDSRLTLVQVDLLKDVLEPNSARVLASGLATRFNHSIRFCFIL